MDEKKIVDRLSRVGIFGNILLAAFKLFAGIFGKSGAMVSDAVHSLSDVFATLIAWIGALVIQGVVGRGNRERQEKSSPVNNTPGKESLRN